LLQGYAEGYEILAASKKFPGLDLHQIAELWQHGSVVRSWLNELAVDAFSKDAKLEKLKGFVADSGEGRWTVMAAIEEAVPAPVLSAALYERFGSRGEANFADKLLSALRHEFGGHVEKPATQTGGG
jgi:6-phosphogluconate dehydrogenase